MSIPTRAARPDEHLVAEARERLAVSPAARDRAASALLGTAFVVTAGALALGEGGSGGGSLGTALLLVAAYAIASRVEFEVGAGAAVPTALVFVPMLFLLPPAVVPLLVAAGLVLGAVPDYARRAAHPERIFVLLTSSWYSVGPALVLALADPGPPSVSDWPLYAVALAAQFGCDAAAATTREWLAFRFPPRLLAGALFYAYSVDALLAPAGLLAAAASTGGSYAWLLVLPVVALLALMADERRARIDRAIASDRAYRAAATAARSDPLTGLGNRLAWEEALALADEAAAADRPSAVLLLDLDDLKRANDTLGHEAGDALLRALADLVRSHVRGTDLVARIGGDELAVLMTGATEREAADALTRLCAAIDAHPPVRGMRLSASVGSATCPPAASAAEAQRAADRRMYDGKKRRRS